MDKCLDTLLKKLDQDSKEIIDSILTSDTLLKQYTHLNLSNDISNILIDIPDLYQENWGENFEYMTKYLKNIFNIIFKEHKIILLKEILDKIISLSKILKYDCDLPSLYETLNNQSINNKHFKFKSTNLLSFGICVDNNENDMNTDLKILMISLNVFTFSNCEVDPIYVLFEINKSGKKKNLKFIGLLCNIKNPLMIEEIQDNAIIIKIIQDSNSTFYGILYFNLKNKKYVSNNFKHIKINRFPIFELSNYDNLQFDYSLPITVDKSFKHILSEDLDHLRVQSILQEMDIPSCNYRSYLRTTIKNSIKLINMKIFLPKYILHLSLLNSKLKIEPSFIIPLYLKKNINKADLFLILSRKKEQINIKNNYIEVLCYNNCLNKEHYYISTVLESHMVIPLCRIFGPIQENWILNSEDHKITLQTKKRAKYKIDIESIISNTITGRIVKICNDEHNNIFGFIKATYLNEDNTYYFPIKNLPKDFLSLINYKNSIQINLLLCNLILQESVSFILGKEFNNNIINKKIEHHYTPIAFANSIQFNNKNIVDKIYNKVFYGNITKLKKYWGFITTNINNDKYSIYIPKESIPIELIWLLDRDIEETYCDYKVSFKINYDTNNGKYLNAYNVFLNEVDKTKIIGEINKIKEINRCQATAIINELIDETIIRSQTRQRQNDFEIEQNLEIYEDIYEEIGNEISIIKKDPNYYYDNLKSSEIEELYSSLSSLRGKISRCFEDLSY